MRATEIIQLKRDGRALTPEQIREFVEGYVAGNIPDYQVSAFLMAVFFQGMTTEETAALTIAMLKSGRSLPRTNRKDFWVDKHSTGGVGDKTSLLLVPLVVATARRIFGPGKVKIPMISGRGLGFTGGTLDKLESVPGFSPSITETQALRLLEKSDYFMMGQTPDIAPADRLLYSLRDVTSTIESLPLIVSSIMSKKLAESLDGLVLDVKFGTGAFMKEKAKAVQLARALKAVAEANDVKCVALVTRMDEPLGRSVGNALEVEECAAFLKGTQIEEGLEEVTLALATQMLSLAGVKEASKECEMSLSSGEAWRVFIEMFEQQGGDWKKFEERATREDLITVEWKADRDGWISRFDALAVGRVVNELGGGRATKEDIIDSEVGLIAHCKVGDKISKGEVMATVHCRKGQEASDKSAIEISPSPVKRPTLIEEVLARD